LAKILIVQDDPAVQMAIRLLLERAGHDASIAGDGPRGLALFEACRSDLPPPRAIGLKMARWRA
jgi:CheY-like chemotaxis protein